LIFLDWGEVVSIIRIADQGNYMSLLYDLEYLKNLGFRDPSRIQIPREKAWVGHWVTGKKFWTRLPYPKFTLGQHKKLNKRFQTWVKELFLILPEERFQKPILKFLLTWNFQGSLKFIGGLLRVPLVWVRRREAFKGRGIF